jgi:hypothetical protein
MDKAELIFEKLSGLQAEAYKILKPSVLKAFNMRTMSDVAKMRSAGAETYSKIRPTLKQIRKEKKFLPLWDSISDDMKTLPKFIRNSKGMSL